MRGLPQEPIGAYGKSHENTPSCTGGDRSRPPAHARRIHGISRGKRHHQPPHPGCRLHPLGDLQRVSERRELATKITANGCSDWFRAAVACKGGDGFGPPIKAVGKTSTASCPAGGGPISSEYGWEWSSNKTTWNDGQFTSV